MSAQIKILKSEDRGHADHGWLKALHSFSFADYYNPEQMGFRALRVINEDRIEAAQGFGTHPHRDMEIVTFIMEGALEHKDSMGNGSVIKPGDIQYMSAGSGVQHSEFNHSKTEGAHLMQIWILPNVKSAPPRYGQKHFTTEMKKGRFCCLVSPDGRDDSIAIRQDAMLYASVLESSMPAIEYRLGAKRYAWLQVLKGSVTLNAQKLETGDAAAISEEMLLKVKAESKSAEILLFDLP